MSSLTQIPIFGYDKGGLVKFYKPLLLENDGFQTLENAVVFRGQLQKKFGNKTVGRLKRDFTNVGYFKTGASPWSFNINKITGYISNANNANPGVITTFYPHNLSNGDQVYISGVLGATGYNTNSPYTITVINSTSFSVGVNAAAFGAYTSGGFFFSNHSISSIEPNAEIVCGSVVITLDPSGANIVITDQGNGLLTSPTAGNYGYINYITGNIYLVHTVGAGKNVNLTYSYYPCLPVMGIKEREIQSINEEQTILFDTRYAYTYNGTDFEEFIPKTAWNSLNYKFFWTENYRGATEYERYFFVTNFIPNADNPMRYTNGSTWTDFQPIVAVNPGPINFVMYSAKILISYYGRLLALNTYEGDQASGPGSSVNYFNRCRFSQIGSPVAADAWRSDLYGKGGFIDAPTNEEIISVAYIKNTLIVFFEQTTWQLRYVGDYGLPFIWERISSDFGAESTFSSILFNDNVLAVGDKAIIAVNSTDAQRIDLQIPDFVFDDISNSDNGPERVYGIRDYQKELVYWCYTLEDTQKIFPNRVLVYNYRNNTYSIFRDNVTCFGTLQITTTEEVLWNSTKVNWGDYNIYWGGGGIQQSSFPAMASGNAHGYIQYYGYTTENEVAASITNINLAVSPIVVTSPDHNLEANDIIKIKGLHFINTTTFQTVATSLNDQIYQVQPLTKDTFAIYKFVNGSFIANFSYTPTSTATYAGCGEFALLPKMTIQTKDFNPFQSQGLQTKASYFDFCLMTTEATNNENNAFSIVINVNSSPTAVANMITGNKELETVAVQPFYTNNSNYAWHRFFATLNGQFFSLTLTYDNELMSLEETHKTPWELYGITMAVRTGGRNTF